MPTTRTTTDWLEALLDSGQIRIRRGRLLKRSPDPAPRAWDRVEGMLLGLAIGDALGNTSEGQFPGERRRDHGEIRDYLPNDKAQDRPVGLPSDDTQLAFWTLEQALVDGHYEPEALARKFVRQGVVRGRSSRRGNRTCSSCGTRRRATRPRRS